MTGRAPPRPIVVVVEDEDVVRESLATILRFEGYDVFSHASGTSLIRSLSLNPRPSAVVLDLTLRDMSGVQCLRAIRSSTWGEVPVLVFSAWGHLERFGIDAQHYLLKGRDIESVVRAIDRLVERSRTRGTPSSPRARKAPPAPKNVVSSSSSRRRRP